MDNKLCINNTDVISRLETVRSTHVHDVLVEKTVTPADALRKILTQIQNENKNSKNGWPSAYFRKRKNSTQTVGHAVIDLEDKITQMIRRTIAWLDNQSNLHSNRLNSVARITQPNLTNTHHEFRKI